MSNQQRIEAIQEANDTVTHTAVSAALEVLDDHFGNSNRSHGPLGDALAFELHEVIRAAIDKHTGISTD